MRKLLTLLVIATAAMTASLRIPHLRASGGFTPGNLVVYRVGDTTAALGSTATAVFLDEYTTAGALVQSIAMPTLVSGANKRLTASGTATSEGGLTLSVDGQFLTAAGYDAAPGTASITTSSSATVNRVIARIDATGAVDTSTALTDAISGGNPRGAVSTNGMDLWISGTSSGGGVRYAAFGATTSTSLSTTVTNLRHLNIFGGQLYVSSASGAFRLATVGAGTPTTSGQTIANLPGITTPASPYGFFFADLTPTVPGLDTVYIADDSAVGSGGGIKKFSLSADLTTWVLNSTAGSGLGLRGLTGSVAAGTVTLYAAGTSTLAGLTDSGGYNAPISGAVTTIATAPTNTAFRGVAFTPGGVAPPPTTTNPSGVGTATPNSAAPGATTLLTVGVTPGTNPPSTNLVVTANLSSLGGNANQQLFDDGSNGDATAGDKTFSVSLTVPSSPAGPYSIPFAITDGEGRTGSGAIALTVQSPTVTTPPLVISQIYGGGGNSGATLKNDFIELFNSTSDPVPLAGWSVQYTSGGGGSWQVTTLTGTIGPGAYYLIGESAGAGGTVNLPATDAAGGIAMSATAGRVALVQNPTALAASTCPATATGVVDFVGYGNTSGCGEGGTSTPAPSNTAAVLRRAGGCTDTNNNNADFTTGTPFPRNHTFTGVCGPVTPPPVVSIDQVQGTGDTSPFAGQAVTTLGIVTGLKTNGFFIQTPDAEADTDPNTSEGVFVFTGGGQVPAAAAVGNYVSVTGTVQEFRPAAGNPTSTEISASPVTTLLSTGNPLPAPVNLTAQGAPQPGGGFDQLERYEGMRVSVDLFTVVEGTGGSVNEANATGSSFGDFYGVLTGTPRPFREPGIELPTPPPNPPCCIPQFDANPERLRIDSSSLGGTKLEVAPGAVLTNVVGVLDFNFDAYSINVDPAVSYGVQNAAAMFTAVPPPTSREFTVASFNMEHFFDTVDDPDTPFDVALTQTALDNRLNKASLAIRNVLRMPDILGIEEMEHLATLQQLAAKISGDAVAAGQPDPAYQALLFEGNDPSGIDIGILAKSGRVTVDNVVQLGLDTTFVNPSGATELLNDRPPVVLHATVHVAGAADFPITVVVNHLKSLIGVETLDATGARNRAKRAGQAEYLANLVQPLQAAGERVAVVGDFNAFQFNDGYVDVIGTIEGHPAPSDQVLTPTTPGLVDPALVDLVDLVPADNRYSYSFNGNLQEIDHAMVTQNLLPYSPRLEYGRMDAGFPETYRSDPNRPERVSDHDPIVAYFTVPLVTTLTYTGATTVTAGDALAVSATIAGPSTGSVTFTLDNGQTATGAIAGAAASAVIPSVTATAGPHALTVSFAGDAIYLPASTTATVAVVDPTSVSYTGPTTGSANTSIAFTAALRDAATDAPVAGQVIAFSVGAANASATTDAGGTATVSLTLGVGTFPIAATFAGAPGQYLLGSSASAQIVVSDTAPPVLTLPPNAFIVATSPSGATFTYTASAADDVNGPVAVSCAPPSGSVFPTGMTTVNCSASDAAGNVATGSFQVLVEPATVAGAMMGEGRIETSTQIHEFAFFVRERASGADAGAISYRRRATHGPGADQFISLLVTSVSFFDAPGTKPGKQPLPTIDQVTFSGIGFWNGHPGYTFSAQALDAGEPGHGRDQFQITIRNPGGGVVATVNGTLDAGNIDSLRR